MSVETVDHISTLPPAPHRPVSALQCNLTYLAALLVVEFLLAVHISSMSAVVKKGF